MSDERPACTCGGDAKAIETGDHRRRHVKWCDVTVWHLDRRDKRRQRR